MVSRFFTNPRWESKAVIEWRSNETSLYIRTDDEIEKWNPNSNRYKDPQEALDRCLRAVEKERWIEIAQGEVEITHQDYLHARREARTNEDGDIGLAQWTDTAHVNRKSIMTVLDRVAKRRAFARSKPKEGDYEVWGAW